MDFVHDALAAGRPFRILTLVDQWRRSRPLLEVASKMSGYTVGEALDRVLEGAPRPRSITVDHGTEFQSRALEDWAYRRGVQLDFIRPAKPIENAFIESFNGRFRDECLNVHQFASIADVPRKIEAWRLDYNQRRPHGSLGHLTPSEFVAQRQAMTTAEVPPLSLRVVSFGDQRQGPWKVIQIAWRLVTHEMLSTMAEEMLGQKISLTHSLG